MPKSIPDAILDAMLASSEGTHIAVTSGEPASYAAISGLTLAGQAISGSITAAAGDTSGRKNIYPAQSAISISSSGTGNHVVTHNNSDTMYLVTTCADQALTSGGTVDLSAFDHELNDPT